MKLIFVAIFKSGKKFKSDSGSNFRMFLQKLEIITFSPLEIFKKSASSLEINKLLSSIIFLKS